MGTEMHCGIGVCPELSNGKHVCDVLPECGCGTPERIRAHYLRVLHSFSKDAQSEVDEDSDLDMLVLYVLDARDLTEHGSTVLASWLTPLGEEFLRVATEHWAKPDVEA